MTMKWKCVICSEGVLTGYEEVDDSTLQPNDIAFDVKPDLEPGQYRWNGEAFEIANRGQWFVPDGPDAWYAVFRALVHIQRNTAIDFPAPVKVWLKYYYNNFKRPGDTDPEA